MEDLNRILAYLLCAVGLHQWSKWSDPKKHPQSTEDTGQERKCLRCCRLDWHLLYRTGKCDPHKWELFKTFNLMKEKNSIPFGTQYIHRCTRCGEMKEQRF